MKTLDEFVELFAEQFDFTDPSTITPSTVFHDLDEWSSISVMLLIAFMDEEFGKEITLSDIKNAATIQDLYNFATA